MIYLPFPFSPWIQRKCVASSRLEGISRWVRQPQRTFQNRSSKSPLIMTNFNVQNLRNVKKLFPPKFSAVKFSAAPTARLAGEKTGGCCSPCRGRPAVSTPHRVRVVGGVVRTLTYAFLSVCAAAHKTWPILYAHSPNILRDCP